MKIVTARRVLEYASAHSVAASNLGHWLQITKASHWTTFRDVKSTFSSADSVEVESGHQVVVFNIAGNRFRLITAIHYNMKKVFVLRFLTQAVYSKGRWRREL
jgi:mRNA interferase HigB